MTSEKIPAGDATALENAPASQLTEGDELNALVAERVFGMTGRTLVYAWADRKQQKYPTVAFTIAPDRWPDYVRREYSTLVDAKGEKLPAVYVARSYSEFIADAWLVVDALVAHGKEYTCIERLTSGRWRAVLCDARMRGPLREAEAETAPLAICLAALLAVELRDAKRSAE